MPAKLPAYQYAHLDNEKNDSDSGSDRVSAEENEGLIHNSGLPVRQRSKGVRRWLEDPCVTFISGGFMFSVLLIIGIVTLAIIQNQHIGNSSRSHGHHTQMQRPGAPDAGATIRNEKGLRMTPDGKLLECGETAKEAAENNCVFDAFAFSYIPPACFERDLMEEALNPESYLAPYAAGEFPWYQWSNFTDPVPQTAEALKNYKSLWTNNAWHKAHCLYEWRLITRALHRQAKGVKPVYVLKRALEVAHVNHCNQMVSDPLTHDESPIWAMRSVGRCIRIDENEGDWEEPELNF